MQLPLGWLHQTKFIIFHICPARKTNSLPLGKVFGNEFGHLKHIDCLFAAKNLL